MTLNEFTVTAPTGRVFVLRELSARDQMAADSCADQIAQMLYYRTAMSIIKIDSEEVRRATSKPELDARIESMTGREADVLAMVYNNKADPTADLKNELTAPPSDS